jgi:hypothetical protein
MKILPFAATFAAMAALFAAGAYWTMELAATPAAPSAPTLSIAPRALDANLPAKALGEAQVAGNKSAPARAPANMKIAGVAAYADGDGIALISLEGKPSFPYRRGALLPNGHGSVMAVYQDKVTLQTPEGQIELVVPKRPTALPPLPAKLPQG